ncbi:MAG: M48 family metallopeptidase [Anaerolineae bacterium]|jgi:predicted metal-dependent hydrolase
MNDNLDIRIIRSVRRKKTVSARLLNWHTLEVRAPATATDEQLEPIIQKLKDRTLRARGVGRPSDEALQQRAERLNKRYFRGKLRWRSIHYVNNQRRRFGSCTPAQGTIRISSRLARVPSFVLDYVIVHELAHLLEPNHSRAFWDLVYRYKLAERARGYLMALQMEDDSPEDANNTADMDTQEGEDR